MGCFPDKDKGQKNIHSTPTTKGKSVGNDQTEGMIEPPRL